MSASRPRGVQGRLWVTLTEIAQEFRVRPTRIRELGLLDGCRRLPAGAIGRYELWRWEDVERSVLEHVSGRTSTTTTTTSRRTFNEACLVPLGRR